MSSTCKDDGLKMHVYHERKSKSSSGLHAINNLLQRPGVTELDLDKIGQISDKVTPLGNQDQAKSLRKKASSRAWTNVMKTCSRSNKENKDGKNSCTGETTVEVVQKALKPFGVRLLQAGDPELHGPDAAPAWGYVVCACGQWSTVRQVGEQHLWVDLDPSLERPELMSAAEVFRLQVGMPPKSGGVVFAVVGSVPPCPIEGGRGVVRMSVDPRSICTTSFNL